MKRLCLTSISRLSIKEISALKIEELLELLSKAEENLKTAKRLKDWINGTIALKNSNNIMEV